MSAEFNESQQITNPGNPEQEPKDPKIATVIRTLTKAATEFQEYLQKDLSAHSWKEGHYWFYGDKNIENSTQGISVGFDGHMFTREDYAKSNLPRRLQEHDRIIPLEIRFMDDMSHPHSPLDRSTRIWINLDENNPTIFQLRGENWKAVGADDKITGKEEVVERHDLLPTILRVVF